MSEPNSPLPTSTLEYYHRLPPPEALPPRPRYWVHGLLLIATCFTTLVVGAQMEFNFLNNYPLFHYAGETVPFFKMGWILQQPSRLLLGIPFSATLLTILLAHEMGHYVFCRYYGVRATLPFFIPAPTLIGTMGAVIRIRGRIRSRTALFDIGIAGPIAGFLVAIATLVVSMSMSKPFASGIGPSEIRLGFPPIFYLVQHILRAVAPGLAISQLPLSRIYLHPTAVAAWVGMYATALNLLPSGQLDGGHIVYALAPRAHRVISWITVVALVFMGRFNYGWWVWAGLITAMNILTWRQRQAPEYPAPPASRWALGLLAILMLALTLTLSPLQTNF